MNGALRLSTLQYGSECRVKLDKTDVPSGYMAYDLFDNAALSVLKPGKERSEYTPASLKCCKKLDAGIVIPQNMNTLAFKITTDPAGARCRRRPDFRHTRGAILPLAAPDEAQRPARRELSAA